MSISHSMKELARAREARRKACEPEFPAPFDHRVRLEKLQGRAGGRRWRACGEQRLHDEWVARHIERNRIVEHGMLHCFYFPVDYDPEPLLDYLHQYGFEPLTPDAVRFEQLSAENPLGGDQDFDLSVWPWASPDLGRCEAWLFHDNCGETHTTVYLDDESFSLQFRMAMVNEYRSHRLAGVD